MTHSPNSPPPEPLPVAALYTACDPATLHFETTAELSITDPIVGQERARTALAFGIGIQRQGFNVFVLGPAGIGKLSMIRQLTTDAAGHRKVPPDWCYVHDFDHPQRPCALQLPAGRGTDLRRAMTRLVEELADALPAAFDSEDYRSRMEELEQELKERQHQATSELGKRAREQRIALIRTPGGFAFAPMNSQDEVMPPEQFAELPLDEQQSIERLVEELQQTLQKTLRQFPAWAREVREKVQKINREIAELATHSLIAGVREAFADLPAVLNYLEAVERHIIENVDDFLPNDGETSPFARLAQDERLQRYRVNLLVNNSALEHAPVIHEDLPSYPNLLGRSEYQARMGTLATDFTLLRSGALHRANGGYLILDARQLLSQPFAWEMLKRALQSREIRIETLENTLGLISTVSLKPEPIPLVAKIILFGERRLYYLLSELDPEFADLFKVMADFDESMDRSPEAHHHYACLFATLIRRHELRELNRGAAARLIEHCARLTNDSEKLSTHLRSITDVLQEADYWAGEAGQDIVDRAAMEKAVTERIERAARLRQHDREQIRRGTLLIDTRGSVIGQINGLSVLILGAVAFGRPTRITATTRLGDGTVIDIERETELGGPIHSKGVMILSGFLSARYAVGHPLSMAASLVFEQSYGMVEGDSASLAELCALLSSLAGLPIHQHFAVTGSVNQHGRVQPIGGVNEKIEGFFEVCRDRGLNGAQGVLIPEANVKHLMLHRDVVQAVADRQFAIHAVSSVDQALTLLTGIPAGVRDDGGRFPESSVNARVEARLIDLSEQRRRFSGNGSRNHDAHDDERR